MAHGYMLLKYKCKEEFNEMNVGFQIGKISWPDLKNKVELHEVIVEDHDDIDTERLSYTQIISKLSQYYSCDCMVRPIIY